MKTIGLLILSMLVLCMGYMYLDQDSYERFWYGKMGFGPDTVEVVVVRMYSPVTGVLSEARSEESIRWERRGYIQAVDRSSSTNETDGTLVTRQKWVRPAVSRRQ